MQWQRQIYYGQGSDDLHALMRFANLTKGLPGHPSYSDHVDEDGWKLIVVWPVDPSLQLERLEVVS